MVLGAGSGVEADHHVEVDHASPLGLDHLGEGDPYPYSSGSGDRRLSRSKGLMEASNHVTVTTAMMY
jgi:hypothetical protein